MKNVKVDIMNVEEKLAIGEAIHAMAWLDKNCEGWGLEKERTILQNMGNNIKEKEIAANHRYLELQYKLDDAIKENEKCNARIKELESMLEKTLINIDTIESLTSLADEAEWQLDDDFQYDVTELRDLLENIKVVLEEYNSC